LKRTQLDQQKQITKYLLIAVAAVVFSALALSGRLSWLLALMAGLIAMLPRLFSLAMRFMPALLFIFRKISSRSSTREAQVSTEFLHITINQSTGDMQGQVLKGAFKNRTLASLRMEDLLTVLDMCQQHDNKSASLLVAYLDRHHQNWKNNGAHSQQGFKSGTMSADEARDILALKENATRKEIIQAHRKLMQKMHPDRGGSDYLAAKINQAKEALISQL
jgi:hypothetical protein